MAKRKKGADAPEPKDLDTQIKEATAELSDKPVQPVALAGTRNALATHLHIKGLFNSIYTGVVLGSLVASAAGIIFGKVTFTDRLKLFPESVRALLGLAQEQLPRLADLAPATLAGAVALILVCWIKGKVWPAAFVVTRLILLVFWIAVAYWLLAVLGLGEAAPRWPSI